MKNLITIVVIALIFGSCSSNKTVFVIPQNSTIEIDYAEYDMTKATIKNKSFKEIDVVVLSKENSEQVRGFGLGVRGEADVMVERENKLVLKNTSNSSAKVALNIASAKRPVPRTTNEYISFTLQNKTAKSIPLIIPTVMNPNLSPFSKSGVDLKVGQEILFKAKGKKHVLLVVDNTIKEGELLDVAAILKKKKQDLGLL